MHKMSGPTETGPILRMLLRIRCENEFSGERVDGTTRSCDIERAIVLGLW